MQVAQESAVGAGLGERARDAGAAHAEPLGHERGRQRGVAVVRLHVGEQVGCVGASRRAARAGFRVTGRRGLVSQQGRRAARLAVVTHDLVECTLTCSLFKRGHCLSVAQIQLGGTSVHVAGEHRDENALLLSIGEQPRKQERHPTALGVNHREDETALLAQRTCSTFAFQVVAHEAAELGCFVRLFMLLAALLVGAHNGQRHLTARFGEKETSTFFGQAGSAAQQAHEVELAHKFILLAQTVLHCIQGKSDELELILHVAPARRELGDNVLKWLVDALGQI